MADEIIVPAPGYTLTVLRSHSSPTTKRYFIDADGAVKSEPYQDALTFKATPFNIWSIRRLGRLLRLLAKLSNTALIRGFSPRGKLKKTWRDKDTFPEHSEGTPWVMLDMDGIALPQGMSPVSVEAIQWLIRSKLPQEFQVATCYYQFSGSAGILDQNGELLKPGLRVHLFFFLDRRIPGKDLDAYLRLHCLDTGFYSIEANRSGVAMVKYGIDPAPIRSAVQLHYTANPIIDAGVDCLLTAETRSGFVEGLTDVVTVPEITPGLVRQANGRHGRTRVDWMKANGYEKKSIQTRTRDGTAITDYYTPPGANTHVRGGRLLERHELRGDDTCRLYFTEENSPGSWFVTKREPQIARRYGDHEAVPLKELSESAYRVIRDELKWFSEIAQEYLPLTGGGYMPPIDGFARAKVSLILAPTGTGKTKAAVDWIRARRAELTIYAAPTIALVNQMYQDLEAANLKPMRYKEVGPGWFPQQGGVIVTTNESKGRILRIAYEQGLAHNLILDEIHDGLDDSMSSNRKNRVLEEALSKASRTLMLTGTLTPLQRRQLSQTVTHALCQSGPEHYAVYEFPPAKRNPLVVRKIARFDTDLVRLLEDCRAKKQAGTPLPRIVLLMPTSRMEFSRRLLGQYGLLDDAHVISRPECSPEEIETARASNRAILASSPLFSLGLNFVNPPEIFLCHFTHLNVDTSNIIQTLNRANRTALPCEVTLYVGETSDEPIYLPNQAKLAARIAEDFRAETSLAGYVHGHWLIDRNVYKQLRLAEKNTAKSLGWLISNDAFQNYAVVPDPDDGAEISKTSNQACKEVRKDARAHYNNAILRSATQLGNLEAYECFWKLDQLTKEEREGYKLDNPRTPLAIENDRLAVVMRLCRLDKPTDAKKVKISKLRRLFGEDSPWVSGQYHRASIVEWASAEAEKTLGVLEVGRVLAEMKTGTLDGPGFAARLTRNKQLTDGMLSLVSSEDEYLKTRRELDSLKAARDKARERGSKADRDKVSALALKQAEAFLAGIGVGFERAKGTDGKMRPDFAKPIVPANWDLVELVKRLDQRAAWLKALPVEQKVPILDDEDTIGDKLMPREICEGCVFFYQNACVQGRQVDWQGGEWEERLAASCPSFKPIKIRIRLKAGEPVAHEP